MIGREARIQFERFLTDRGVAIARLTVDEAFGIMVAFYKDVPADDCPIDDDGDMLLFQSGSFGPASAFEWSITRQLMPEADPDPGEVWQLELRTQLSAEAGAALSVDDGDAEWCDGPSGLDDFIALVASHPATVALRTLGALEFQLRFDNAE